MEDYLMNTRDQYYMEGGMRVYNLKEVTVTAKRERPSSKSIYTGGINTYTVEEDRLQGYGQTAFDGSQQDYPALRSRTEVRYISATNSGTGNYCYR